MNRTSKRPQIAGGGADEPPPRGVLTFTGHRPQRLGGFKPESPIARWVKAQLRQAVDRATTAGFHTFIAGGALGFDTWAAQAVLDCQQDLILALPFAGHDLP